MQLRFIEDRRTLIWAFVLFPSTPLLGYSVPALLPLFVPIVFYLAYCTGVLTHNHLHSPVFRSARANDAYSAWLSFFYGVPVFTWLPTHNGNHHRFVNGEGDVTQTSRHSARNTLWAALTYPSRAALWQARVIVRFVADAGRRRSPRFRQIVVQSAVVLLGHTALLACAWVHRGFDGVLLYAALVGAPALFAPWAMMFTNYLQHVDCEPASRYDHSRNFVHPVWNWLVFDAGYHTVHHEQPGLHWSACAAAHRACADRIDPRLNASTPITYCAKTYLLRPWTASLARPGSALERAVYTGGPPSSGGVATTARNRA